MAKRAVKRGAKKGRVRAPAKTTSVSTVSTHYWSGYNVDRLVKQCKSRKIPVPSKTLKRQEYIDKLQDSTAAHVDRDWTHLIVEDLKKECELLGITTTGLKRPELLEKLEKGTADRKDGDSADPKAPGDPPSDDKGEDDDGSKNPDNDYDKWDYRTQLLPEWTKLDKESRGSKKRADIIAALKERDKKAAEGPGAGSQPSNPGTGQGPSGGQRGSGPAGGIINPPPSPTTSVGEDFNTPITAPAAAVEAARIGIDFARDHARGFSNDANHCYRNATIVMLLHSSRLLSWIEHWHIPNLVDSGVGVNAIFLEDGAEAMDAEDDDGYTDVWCELLRLSKVYWETPRPTQAKIDRAMRTFWEYLTHNDRQNEVDDPIAQGIQDEMQQQDVAELLDFFVALGAKQFELYLDVQGVPADSELRRDIENRNAKGLMNVAQTVRVLCSQRPDVRHRFAGLEEANYLTLSMPDADPASSGRPSTQNRVVTLQSCLLHNARYEHDWPCRCPAASPVEAENANTAPESTSNQNAWRKIYAAPEVLFLKLEPGRKTEQVSKRKTKRSTTVQAKDGTKVEIPPELDLTPFLEKRNRPANLSAKYKLKAIVSHSGTLAAGHYIAQVRGTDSWSLFNDSLPVAPVTLDNIVQHKLTQKRTRGDFHPYLLMYERIPEGAGHNESNGDDGDEENTHAKGSSKDAGPNANDNAAGNERRSRSPRPPQMKGHHATNKAQQDERLEIFVRFCTGREADWRAKHEAQTRRIAGLEDIITTLLVQNQGLQDLVGLGRKRRHDQISGDGAEAGGDSAQFIKKLRQLDYQGASTDAIVGSLDDAISEGSGDTIIESFGEEDLLEATDSESTSMSESEEGGGGGAQAGEEGEILSSPIDPQVYEEYCSYRDQLIRANLDLVHEREVAKHDFADAYANQHNIVRGHGPWGWMGPRHQQDFEHELKGFLDQWEEWVLERTAREDNERRRQLARAARATRVTSTGSPFIIPPQISPSAKFYNINTEKSATTTSPRSDRVSKTAALGNSPRKNQIPTPPISSPRHPARTPPPLRNPVTPPQPTWHTPAVPRGPRRVPYDGKRPSPIKLTYSTDLSQANETGW